MTEPIASVGQANAIASDREKKLREAAHQLEAVFLNQLLAVMRQTVPQSGLLENSSAEWLFNSMLDEQLSTLAARRSSRGLGEALYRQLSRRLQDSAGGLP